DMESIASAIKSVVKAKYGSDKWLEVAEALKGNLREKQRDALVAHLIAKNDDFDDTTDLYDYYLIDVDMTACMVTSRIKQAICSVQLYIQRCLLNLEEDVSFSEDAAEQWEWMKTYRVWEAARKIFLYPENWIEPELRDDKTSAFSELEATLLS